MISEENKDIVLFDSDCIFCSKAVSFILNNENKSSKLFFASLNSEIGLKLRKKYQISINIDSLIFINNEKYFIKSDAVIQISKYLKLPYSLLKYTNWISIFVRDNIYDFIAKNRKKLLKSSNESCEFDVKHRNRILE